MKILFSYLFVFLSVIRLNAQANLVANPSFELYNSCPINTGQINNAPPWDNILGGGGGTPDYFNGCASSVNCGVPINAWGYQHAHTGNAYSFVGVYIATSSNSREYMQTALIDTLKPGKIYCIEFFVSAADFYKYATDAIGIYFSKTPISSPTNLVLPFIAQVENPAGNILSDTANWTKVSGLFTATGGEKYLIIGNFKNDVNTNRIIINSTAVNTASGYFVDDVSVIEIKMAHAGKDTTICSGSAVQLGIAADSAVSYSWTPSAGLNNPTISNPIANPLQSTIYYLTANATCDYITQDSVVVSVLDCDTLDHSSSMSIPNIFTPNHDQTNDLFQIASQNITTLDCKIYNRWGVLVEELKNTRQSWDGRNTAGEECSAGVYFYILEAKGADGKEFNERGFVELVR